MQTLGIDSPFLIIVSTNTRPRKEPDPPMAYRSPTPLHAPRYGRKGFVRASSAAKGMIRPALTKRGFSEPRLLVEWDAVVGAQIGDLCRPVKMGYASKQGMGGTLTVGALGACALEVQHLTPRIVERVNAHYGYRAIARIRLVQLGPEAFEERRKGRTVPHPRPEDVARIRRTVEPVANEGLRGALERLGHNIALGRSPAATDNHEREKA